jgi:hypothetical protein
MYKPNDLIIVRDNDCETLYIVEVSNVHHNPDVIEGRYKTIIDIDDRPQHWDADGCVGVFDDFTLIQKLN